MDQNLKAPRDTSDTTPKGPRRVSVLTMVAWVVILAALALRGVLPLVDGPEPAQASNQQTQALMDVFLKIQGRLMLASKRLADMNGEPMPSDSITPMETGSIGQRQRVAALAAVVLGPAQAGDALDRLKHRAALLGVELTADQQRIDTIIRVAASDRPLSQSDRTLLEDQLGWFGELLVARTQPDQKALWNRFQDRALNTLIAVIAVIGGIGLIGVLGLAGLVLGVIKLIRGTLRPLEVTAASSGLYAQTFAVWLIVFLGLSQLAAQLGLGVAVLAFWISLVALLWLPFRGVVVSRALSDIGWHRGAGLWREFGAGLAGYAMMLPIMGVGILGTLGLFSLDAALQSSAPEHLDAQTGPAHPIFAMFQNASVGTLILIFFLAVVTAPVIEETFFRGVFYRHLRSGFRVSSTVWSVIASTGITAFIFAAVHPQGWIAIPALMSIGVALALAREWRSSLIAPMTMHALNNGLMMTVVLMLFR